MPLPREVAQALLRDARVLRDVEHAEGGEPRHVLEPLVGDFAAAEL